MQVFKCALRILRAHLIFPMIYIVGLSFMGILMASSFGFGQLYRRTHFDFALVHKFKQFGDKVCKANITLNL